VPVIEPASAVAGQVDGDRCEPRPEPERRHPLPRIAAHGPERPDQRVLGDLLRIAAVAEQAQGDRVQPVLVVGHEDREGGVEVTGEPRGERGVGVHQCLQHAGARIGFAPGGGAADAGITRS
jgi:hypothetical protein